LSVEGTHSPVARRLLSTTELGPLVKVPRVTTENVLSNVLLALCGLIFILPLIWLVEAAIDAEASRQIQIPVLSWRNFIEATTPSNLLTLWNSIVLSGVATLVATVVSALAAYSFSRHRIPLKGPIILFILFLSGVPITILVVPVYQMFAQVDALSIIPTAIFLGVTTIPFEIYIIKNAIDAIPLDLEEAAKIERASLFRILCRITFPLAFPGIVAAAIYGFVNAWGNFLVPLVLISSSDQQAAPIAIFGFLSADEAQYGAIAAFSIIYSAPVVLLYIGLSRVFRAGFVLGGAGR
jgi:multiple sugar transport system permease protein